MVQNRKTEIRFTFAVLVLAHAARSVEEYLGRLWKGSCRRVSSAWSSRRTRSADFS
jgi:hypothetical protein